MCMCGRIDTVVCVCLCVYYECAGHICEWLTLQMCFTYASDKYVFVSGAFECLLATHERCQDSRVGISVTTCSIKRPANHRVKLVESITVAPDDAQLCKKSLLGN